MVTKDDQKYNYLLIQFFVLICHLPFQFDQEKVQFKRERSPRRLLLFWIFMTNSVICVVYQVLRFFWALLIRDGDLNLMQLSAHFVFVTADTHTVTCAFLLFVLKPDTLTAILNDVAGFTNGKRDLNSQEKYMRTMAIGQACIQGAMVSLFVTMHESPQFYYSALPAERKSLGMLLVMLVYESFTNLFIMSTMFLVSFTQIAFFNATIRRLEAWSHDLRESTATWDAVKTALQRCKRTQRDVARFNYAFSSIVFKFKLFFMSVATGGITFCIHFSTLMPGVSALNLFYGVEAVIMYVTFYGNNFLIQRYVEEMKALIPVHARRTGSTAERKETKLALRSIPRVAVKQANFKHLERESTLIFIDFVLQQVAGLLVGLRSHGGLSVGALNIAAEEVDGSLRYLNCTNVSVSIPRTG